MSKEQLQRKVLLLQARLNKVRAHKQTQQKGPNCYSSIESCSSQKLPCLTFYPCTIGVQRIIIQINEHAENCCISCFLEDRELVTRSVPYKVLHATTLVVSDRPSVCLVTDRSIIISALTASSVADIETLHPVPKAQFEPILHRTISNTIIGILTDQSTKWYVQVSFQTGKTSYTEISFSLPIYSIGNEEIICCKLYNNQKLLHHNTITHSTSSLPFTQSNTERIALLADYVVCFEGLTAHIVSKSDFKVSKCSLPYYLEKIDVVIPICNLLNSFVINCSAGLLILQVGYSSINPLALLSTSSFSYVNLACNRNKCIVLGFNNSAQCYEQFDLEFGKR
ncbi:hypothetical protein P9112_012978 [Eukaryota sp. TZLM1-RC]